MYRDDVCAVCNESLPPDHLYCRDHAAIVDDLLHEIGERLPRLTDDLARLGELVGSIADETWDYLAEDHPADPDWPPTPTVVLTADGADVEVDVDAEPGMVTVSVRDSLQVVLLSLHTALLAAGLEDLAEAARTADGAGATH